MTDDQQRRLAAMQGEMGDEAQFTALLERSQEIIRQSFGMIRMISGSGLVSVLPGKSYLLAADDSRGNME